MPRIPRHLVITEGFQTHKMWKGHNKEWNIAKDSEKEAYLTELNQELKKDSQPNALNAYTIMSNHSHELYFLEDIIEFSNMMRNHHSRYGLYFNKKHKRCGKVAYERPKTCLIEDEDYSMRATFYIHANPVKAGITKNAANYKWSTHRYYAFGKTDDFMKHVVLPDWYMDLGRTMKERQKAYRKMFDAYLRELGLIKQSFLENNFYGSPLWVLELTGEVSKWTKKNRSKDPPRK
jgi:putative transposase